jgi:hypothetical protein
VLAALLAVASPAACKDFFQVDSPLRFPASGLDDPALAPVLVESAIADFECAFGVYVLLSGTLGDELYSSTYSTALLNDWDRRVRSRPLAENGGCAANRLGASPFLGIWLPLSTARYQADDM